MKSRAAVLFEAGQKLEVREVDVQDPGPGEVRIQMVAGGVCHSDLHVMTGHLNAPLPAILGHEGAGVVSDVGAGVTSFSVLGPAPAAMSSSTRQDSIVRPGEQAESAESANKTRSPAPRPRRAGILTLSLTVAPMAIRPFKHRSTAEGTLLSRRRAGRADAAQESRPSMAAVNMVLSSAAPTGIGLPSAVGS